MVVNDQLPLDPPSTDFRLFLCTTPTLRCHSLVQLLKQAHAMTNSATLLVTCAPGSGCQTNFPEQTISHLKGSSWAGQYTISGTTTSWGCNLGRGSDDTLSDQGGWCYAATAGPGSEEMEMPMPSQAQKGKGNKDKSSAVNTCWVETRSKLVFVTAGMEKWSIVEPTKPTWHPESHLKARLDGLKSLHCPMARTRTTMAETVVSSTGSIRSTTTGAENAGSPTGKITKPPVTDGGITSAATSALQAPTSSSSLTSSSSAVVGGGHAGRGRGLSYLLGASALVTLLLG